MEARCAEIQSYKKLATMGEERRAKEAGVACQTKTQSNGPQIEETEEYEVRKWEEPSHTYYWNEVRGKGIGVDPHNVISLILSKIDPSITQHARPSSK